MIRRLLLLAGALLLIGAAEPPPKPITLSPEEAEKQGKALVEEILSISVRQNSTNVGHLLIRKPKGKGTETLFVKVDTFFTPTNWQNVYTAARTNGEGRVYFETLAIVRSGQSNEYRLQKDSVAPARPSSGELMAPFAGSDFWIADLGLEFFRWPVQHLTKKEMNRSRFCRVLESVNPKPEPGGYSMVRSWIDNESDGIVQADAFDAGGKLLKQFFPKDFKKVEGQWQLKEMQISNVQTGSRTTIEFEFE